MKKIQMFFRKTRYVSIFLLGVFTVFVFFSIPRRTGRIEEIFLGKGTFRWTKGKRLFVTNHPSWIDQFLIIALRLPFWSTNFLPYIAAANDNVKRLSYLRFLRKTDFIVPIDRMENKFSARGQIKEMQMLLGQGHSLMMAGSPGRDFKGAENEMLYSPVKGKPLRQFTNLCGRFAVLPGVETVPLCIEGTDKFYHEVEIDGRKDMKFSWYEFIVNFLLLGKLKVRIIYDEPVSFNGNHKEVTRQIQNRILSFLDY